MARGCREKAPRHRGGRVDQWGPANAGELVLSCSKEVEGVDQVFLLGCLNGYPGLVSTWHEADVGELLGIWVVRVLV